MSSGNGLICGRAVFLTWRGLEARGNGTLAGVQQSPGVFEVGRNRGHPLHTVDGKRQSVLFCRRCRGIRRGWEHEIELVGLIAPTKDVEWRSGLFGACVALDADRRQPGGFGNWGGCVKEIHNIFSDSRAMFDRKGPVSFLHEMSLSAVPATEDDEQVDWTATTNEEMLLQCGSDLEGVWDAKVFEYLQAIAFKDGTNHPTMLVFSEAVAGSESLVSERSDECLHLLNKAKSEQLEREDVAGVPSEEPFDSGAEALKKISELEARVRRLQENVDSRRTAAVVSTGSEGYDGEIPLVWIITGIASGVAGGVLAIAAWVLMDILF